MRNNSEISKDFDDEDFNKMAEDLNKMVGTLENVAPKLADSSANIASSMMVGMFKKFWWLFVLAIVISALGLWGLVELILAIAA